MTTSPDLTLPLDTQLRCARINEVKWLLGEHIVGSFLLSCALFFVCRNPVNETGACGG